MHISKLGDSYDFVKRVLLEIRPDGRDFLAVPMFTDNPPVPTQPVIDLYCKFLKSGTHPNLHRAPQNGQRVVWIKDICAQRGDQNIFLDPDTGIRLKPIGGKKMEEYVTTDEIAEILNCCDDKTLLICFDQSLSRGEEDEYCREKLSALKKHKVKAVYFRSHASFLICSMNKKTLNAWKTKAIALGIPSNRFYP